MPSSRRANSEFGVSPLGPSDRAASERAPSRVISNLDQNSHITIQVEAEAAGERLDAFLAAHIDGWSRARLQRLIEDGDVLVGGKLAKPSLKVRAKDQIETDRPPTRAKTSTPKTPPINGFSEDGNVIVSNSPAGMVIHPAAGISQGT